MAAVYRVFLLGVRFVSATYTQTKNLKDLPEGELLEFKIPAQDKEEAAEKVIEWAIEEDVIFEGVNADLA